MKKLLFLLFLQQAVLVGIGQNIGVGTNSPQKLLSVNGSVLIDQENQNNGSLDSAALRLGTATGVGISSGRTAGAVNQHGLDLWTSGNRRISIGSNGLIGINTTAPAYRLDVNGTVRGDNLISQGNLEVAFNTFMNGSARVDGYLGVGANSNANYRLYVDGNALVNTNLGVNGTARVDGATNLNSTLTVDGKITNEGKGIMLSNTSTTLRSGFSKGAFSIMLGAGGTITIPFCIPNFTGDNDNVRVMIGQFVAGSGSSNTGCLVFQPVATSVTNAVCSGGSSVTIRITNACSTTADTGTSAVLHLYTVVTD